MLLLRLYSFLLDSINSLGRGNVAKRSNWQL